MVNFVTACPDGRLDGIFGIQWILWMVAFASACPVGRLVVTSQVRIFF